MYQIFYGDEIKAYSNQYELAGVESIELSIQSEASVTRVLGSLSAAMTATDTPQQKVTISRYLNHADQLLTYTGDSAFPLSVHGNSIMHTFKSGYLSNYAINCAVGAIPKVSTSFDVYDEIIKTTGIGESGSSTVTMRKVQQKDITCICDHYTTDRIVGFDLSITTSREPIYVIGSKKPINVVQNNGLIFDASVQIDVDQAFLTSGLSFLDTREDRTVRLIVSGDSNSLFDVSVPRASLTSQILSASADGGLKLTLNYQGYL